MAEIKLKNLQAYFTFDKRLYFVMLVMLNLIAIFLNKNLILTDSVYYQTYGERVAMERIDRYLDFREQLSWMSYVFAPLVLLIKLSLVAVCINVGTLIANYKISFGKIFKIVLVAEGIFVLCNIIRILWLDYAGVTVLQDVQYFYPLSLINFFSKSSLESWFVYPLITVNIFEILYFFIIALGLHWVLEVEYKRTLGMVASSYGVGLFIWMMFIVFLSINFT